MKQFIVFACLVALVACEPPSQYGPPHRNNYNNNQGYQNNNNQQYNSNNNARILRYDSENNGEQGYKYAYETDDGTSAQEQGYLKDADTAAAQGSYQFVAPDGQQFSITYTADENGYQPQGAHIPTPPPIPADILKGLEQNREEEARGIFDDGQYRPDAAPHQQYNQRNNNNNNNAYKY
ncbi:cuticle protein CP14.6-like [Atheta coriaria]|uniref:cuticle protein CP14.6-like n=1 Tax=Dalotia coriaria TaxID=877792 RepID=UPI0031F3F1FA